MGQTVDEIDIDRADAGGAEPAHGPRGDLETLFAIDRTLNVHVEILHADRNATAASTGQGRDAIVVDAAGIDFDGELGGGVEPEGAVPFSRSDLAAVR